MSGFAAGSACGPRDHFSAPLRPLKPPCAAPDCSASAAQPVPAVLIRRVAVSLHHSIDGDLRHGRQFHRRPSRWVGRHSVRPDRRTDLIGHGTVRAAAHAATDQERHPWSSCRTHHCRAAAAPDGHASPECAAGCCNVLHKSGVERGRVGSTEAERPATNATVKSLQSTTSQAT